MEYWKPVKGYEGLYEVSSEGNVKSLCWGNTKTAKLLYLKKHNKGYLQVELANGKTKKMCLVHRLVATAFIPNPDNLPQVNHIDEDKQNNRVDNLEWCTNSQNMRAYYNNHPGANHNRRKPKERKTPNGHKAPKNNLRNTFPIKQTDLYGNVIRVWAYAIDIKHELGFNSTSIWECCEGIRKTAYGYKWQYDTLYINE